MAAIADLAAIEIDEYPVSVAVAVAELAAEVELRTVDDGVPIPDQGAIELRIPGRDGDLLGLNARSLVGRDPCHVGDLVAFHHHVLGESDLAGDYASNSSQNEGDVELRIHLKSPVCKEP